MGFGFTRPTGSLHADSGLFMERSLEEAFADPKHEVLYNPLTPDYHDLKAWIYSDRCLWTRQGYVGLTDERQMHYNDLQLFSHNFIPRIEVRNDPQPDDPPISERREQCELVLNQIANENGFDADWYRCNANLTQVSKASRSVVHRDHEFPHWNLIIYLSEFNGGRTYVDNEPCPDPKENMIVTFEGREMRHWHEPPAGIEDNRFIIVATYMPRAIDAE